MTFLMTREPTPLSVKETTHLIVGGDNAFHQIAPYKGGEQTKAQFLIIKVTHFPESIDGMANVIRESGVKTLVLEESPKSLMEVFEGKKIAREHVREYILQETEGRIDVEKTPDAFLIPRLASYKHRVETLVQIKNENPHLEIIIIDPYNDKQILGPRGETYKERTQLQKNMKDDLERMQFAIEMNKDFEGAKEHVKAIAKNIAKQVPLIDEMRNAEIQKRKFSGKVAIEEGEGTHDIQKNLKDTSTSVIFANKNIIEKVFKEDKNFQHPLMQLANLYITQGDAIDKAAENSLAAKACAALIMFEREMHKLLSEGKRMTAEKDYEIIKTANSLSTDDCRKISIS